MKKPLSALIILLFAATALMIVTGSGDPALGEPGGPGKGYTVLGRDLTRLKDEFNARKGSVRLLFVVGPTCGICLRGMADLNDEFIAGMQGDARLNTYVVHVPTLGAREEHVAPAIPLLEGPGVFHYWDEVGYIGRHYERVLDIDTYAWDVWFAYGPDALWTDELPPQPDFWQHQLGGLPRAKRLDANVFAAEVAKLLDLTDPALNLASSDGSAAAHDARDGIDIAWVNHSMRYPERSYVEGRGGRRNLERFQSVIMTGHVEIGDASLPLAIRMARPNGLERTVGHHTSLPADMEGKIVAAFDFDGHLFEWRRKDAELELNGMVKLGTVLAWRVDMMLGNGDRWELLIGSHGGNVIRRRLFAADSPDIELEILHGDFRAVEDASFPYRTEYRDGDGRVLAIDRIDSIEVGFGSRS